MSETILKRLIAKKESNVKSIALLIDPDKVTTEQCSLLAKQASEQRVDIVLVGGSILTSGSLDATIHTVKKHFEGPVIIFPGSNMHISSKADGILLLSLVSGRNPDFLIGQHVAAAPVLKKSGLEILPTAYLLVDGGTMTTVHYLSNTAPLPPHKPELAAATALASQMLGMQLTYIDAGSGATRPVSAATIRAVKSETILPLIVGGGITSEKKAAEAFAAGADMLVVGSAVEQDSNILQSLCTVRNKCNNGRMEKV